MTLARLVGIGPAGRQVVTVRGFLTLYQPDQLQENGFEMGDGQVAITNDEIAAAGWPGPPKAGDELDMGPDSAWQVKGVFAVMLGETTIGYNIWVRGGA